MDPSLSDDDERFADLLVAYESRLAAGDSSLDGLHDHLAGANESVRERFEQARDCLMRLDELWPREASPDVEMPKSIDRFQILRELGRGGFGIVYLANDPSLGRRVALKVQRPETILSSHLRKRFVREAMVAARLRHPHIATVYDVDRDGPRFWIASEYCDGASLAAWLHTRQIEVSPRSAAQFLAELADAIEYSHSQGVLHRDLKPSNVLLQRLESVDGGPRDDLACYAPKLIDFGLAKQTKDEQQHTRTGVLIGTPAYMAPELAGGQSEQLGPTADVYGLGVILYELLTGSPPFRGANDADTLRKVVAEEPVTARRLRPGLSRELEAVCAKCLDKTPENRYRSAGALAEDLRRFIRGESTLARPLSPARRVMNWTYRRPALAALVVLSVAASVGFATAYFRETELRRDIERQSDVTKGALEGERRATASAQAEAARAGREAQAADQATKFMTSIFRTSDTFGLAGFGLRGSDENIKQLTLYDVLRRGSRRVEAELQQQPELQARLMNTLGNINRSLGFYDEAEPLLRKAIALRLTRAEKPGPDANRAQLELAESRFNLAWLLHDLGHYDDAQPLYRSALATQTEILGAEDLEVAKTKFNLAWLLADLNEVQQAESLFREVIRSRRRLLPPRDRDILLAEIGLAAVLFSAGREADALREAASTVTGDQLLQMVAMYQLSLLQRRMRSFDLATKSYQVLLDTARSALPPQHPVLAAILIDRAGMLKEKGDYPTAEQSMREGLGIVRSVLGGHPKLIDALTEFAGALEARGDLDEAEKLTRDALAISRQRRPRHAEERLSVLRNLARLRSAQGDCDQAAALLDEAVRLAPEVQPGREMPSVFALAGLKQVSGDWREADELYRRILNATAIVGVDSIEVQLAQSKCLFDEGQYTAGVDMREQALAATHAHYAPRLATLSVSYLVDYARKLVRAGEFSPAIEIAREAITRERKKGIPDHPLAGEHLETAAGLLLECFLNAPPPGRDASVLRAAEKSLHDAQTIYRRRLGEDHAWFGRSEILRAKVAMAGDDRPAAIEATGRGMAIAEAKFPPGHPWRLAAMHESAIVLRDAGALADAERQLRGELSVREQRWPAGHDVVFDAQLDLAKTLCLAGKGAEAEQWLRPTLETLAQQLPQGGLRVARIEAVLGAHLLAQKQYSAAEPLLARSYPALQTIYGEYNPEAQAAGEQLAAARAAPP